MFERILIANRGEIARRIIRACRALGISPVAVHSEADAGALYVREADEAVPIGPPPPAASYLRIDAILEAARRTGAQAVHPGYGFLAENAVFAERCAQEGVVFVGPPAEVIRRMGDKVAARRLMQEAGVPIVPGTVDYLPADPAGAEVQAEAVGYPLLIKAAAGGGGIGMVHVPSREHLPGSLSQARRRAEQAFGHGGLYLERAISAPRHVEVQVLGDHRGRLIHLFERECSVQRRHQKILEETPSRALDARSRPAITAAALAAARAVGYQSAGTVEFLLDEDGRFHFLEMNTRIQVEHPVTEMATGVDLVQQQIRIAAGESLRTTQDDVVTRGHAIECRIYAEDPDTFYPSPGVLQVYAEPTGAHLRIDSGVRAGDTITHFYDPLLAKVVVWGSDRTASITAMRDALDGYRIEGVKTSIPLHQKILTHPGFVDGTYDVTLLTNRSWRAPQPWKSERH